MIKYKIFSYPRSSIRNNAALSFALSFQSKIKASRVNSLAPLRTYFRGAGDEEFARSNRPVLH